MKALLVRLIGVLLRGFDNDASNDPELKELRDLAHQLIEAAKAKHAAGC